MRIFFMVACFVSLKLNAGFCDKLVCKHLQQQYQDLADFLRKNGVKNIKPIEDFLADAQKTLPGAASSDAMKILEAEKVRLQEEIAQLKQAFDAEKQTLKAHQDDREKEVLAEKERLEKGFLAEKSRLEKEAHALKEALAQAQADFSVKLREAQAALAQEQERFKAFESDQAQDQRAQADVYAKEVTALKEQLAHVQKDLRKKEESWEVEKKKLLGKVKALDSETKSFSPLMGKMKSQFEAMRSVLSKGSRSSTPVTPLFQTSLSDELHSFDGGREAQLPFQEELEALSDRVLKRLRQLKHEKEKLCQDNEIITEQLEHMGAYAQDIERLKDQLTQENERLQEELARYDEKYRQAQMVYQAERDALKEQLRGQEERDADLGRLLDRVLELEGIVETQTKGLQQAHVKEESLTGECEDLENRIQELELRLQDKEKILLERERHISDLEQEHQDLKYLYKDLEEQYSQLYKSEQELRRSLGSVRVVFSAIDVEELGLAGFQTLANLKEYL